MLARSARRPRHRHDEAVDLADGDEAPLTPELARILALENRKVEHARGADKVDAMAGEIVGRPGFVPLEHASPLSTPDPTPRNQPEPGMLCTAAPDLASAFARRHAARRRFSAPVTAEATDVADMQRPPASTCSRACPQARSGQREVAGADGAGSAGAGVLTSVGCTAPVAQQRAWISRTRVWKTHWESSIDRMIDGPPARVV